jgi:hypothetical protein
MELTSVSSTPVTSIEQSMEVDFLSHRCMPSYVPVQCKRIETPLTGRQKRIDKDYKEQNRQLLHKQIRHFLVLLQFVINFLELISKELGILEYVINLIVTTAKVVSKYFPCPFPNATSNSWSL